MLECCLQYEGHIHFLRDPPPACRQYPAPNKDSKAQRELVLGLFQNYLLRGFLGVVQLIPRLYAKNSKYVEI